MVRVVLREFTTWIFPLILDRWQGFGSPVSFSFRGEHSYQDFGRYLHLICSSCVWIEHLPCGIADFACSATCAGSLDCFEFSGRNCYSMVIVLLIWNLFASSIGDVFGSFKSFASREQLNRCL